MKLIKLVGRRNDLELGHEDGGTYGLTGLLGDEGHRWKILEWINQELEEGNTIRVVKVDVPGTLYPEPPELTSAPSRGKRTE